MSTPNIIIIRNNTFVFIFTHIQCLYVTYYEVVWPLAPSETQVWPQIILNTDYFPYYLCFSYDYDIKEGNNRR